MRTMKRKTDQKAAIRDALRTAGRPLTAQEVQEAAQVDVPSLGLATVYRNLKDLVGAGELHAVELPSQPTRYEPAHLHHHHHFQCQVCQRVFDVPGCGVRFEADRLPTGFVVRRHEVTFYGECADCRLGAQGRA
jgi:Fur family ferric uptake transcriptional regulator